MSQPVKIAGSYIGRILEGKIVLGATKDLAAGEKPPIGFQVQCELTARWDPKEKKMVPLKISEIAYGTLWVWKKNGEGRNDSVVSALEEALGIVIEDPRSLHEKDFSAVDVTVTVKEEQRRDGKGKQIRVTWIAKQGGGSRRADLTEDAMSMICEMAAGGDFDPSKLPATEEEKDAAETVQDRPY
jgi:hypothetical protein